MKTTQWKSTAQVGTDISNDYASIRPYVPSRKMAGPLKPSSSHWFVEASAAASRETLQFCRQENMPGVLRGVRLSAHTVGLKMQTHYLQQGKRFDLRGYLAKAGFSPADLELYSL